MCRWKSRLYYDMVFPICQLCMEAWKLILMKKYHFCHTLTHACMHARMNAHTHTHLCWEPDPYWAGTNPPDSTHCSLCPYIFTICITHHYTHTHTHTRQHHCSLSLFPSSYIKSICITYQ